MNQTSGAQSEGNGTTPSEQYLAGLCRRAFLSLWAHPNVFSDEGKTAGKGAGNELCDLLVVFGDDVIIFSDKHCEYKETGNAEVDWKRWYRKAIAKSARQLQGAAHFLARFPDRLFLDRECMRSFPLELPPEDRRRIHLVAVTRGSKGACERHWGNLSIGSLRFHGDVVGDSAPFTVGPLTTPSGFVHVFDESTLDAVFGELDTVADFVEYLRRRAALLSRSQPLLMVDGEEQLLAMYLTRMTDGDHDFAVPTEQDGEPLTNVWVHEGQWESFVKSLEYAAKKAADEVSYAWDRLIEHFVALGEQGVVDLPPGVDEERTEPAVRVMAAERRFGRRVLSEGLVSFMRSLEPNKARARAMPSPTASHVVYVLLAEPFHDGFADYAEYRQHRLARLAAYVEASRAMYRGARIVVGIASDVPTPERRGGSEDLYCTEVLEVTEEVLRHAEDVRQKFNLWNPERIQPQQYSASEFPRVAEVARHEEASLSRQQRRAQERAFNKALKKASKEQPNLPSRRRDGF